MYSIPFHAKHNKVSYMFVVSFPNQVWIWILQISLDPPTLEDPLILYSEPSYTMFC